MSTPREPRRTARVLPVDKAGRVLLLFGRDPARPDTPFWFTIGGAIDAGERAAEAGARELYEEVGITALPAELGEPFASQRIEFEWGGRTILQDQAFFAFAVDDVTVSFEHQDADERATIDASEWWTAEALEASGLAAHPTIPEIVRAAVRRVRGG